jgi:hypothetical protein
MLVHFTSVSCQLYLLRGGGSVLSGLWGWFGWTPCGGDGGFWAEAGVS